MAEAADSGDRKQGVQWFELLELFTWRHAVPDGATGQHPPAKRARQQGLAAARRPSRPAALTRCRSRVGGRSAHALAAQSDGQAAKGQRAAVLQRKSSRQQATRRTRARPFGWATRLAQLRLSWAMRCGREVTGLQYLQSLPTCRHRAVLYWSQGGYALFFCAWALATAGT